MQPVDAALELDRLINLLIDWSAAMSCHGTSTESMTNNLQCVHQPLYKKKQEHFSHLFFDKKEECVTFNEGNAPKKEGYKTNINNSKWDNLINRKISFQFLG